MYNIQIMDGIGAANLDRTLAALGEQLARRGGKAHLVVIGGSGLLAIGAVDRTTRDVDVVALAHDGELITSDPLPAAVVDAAAIVARDFGLEPEWLNPGPTALLHAGGLPDGFGGRLIEREYGPALRVSFASRLDQVHFKLYALASRLEPRDEADLRALEPTGDELRAAAAWTFTRDAPGPFDASLARVLARFGVEDARRGT